MTDAYGHYDAADFELQAATTLEESAIQYQADHEPGMRCGRCKQRTGNNHQGHYWKHCHVTKQMEVFHFCCPGDCDRASAWRRQYEVLAESFAELGITVDDHNAFLVPPKNERWIALRAAAEQMNATA